MEHAGTKIKYAQNLMVALILGN